MMTTGKICLKCYNIFTAQTLDKNNGICGRCAKSENRMSNNKKLTIPKKLKEECWISQFGQAFTGLCYSCCDTIKITSFHTGHVVSEYDGGTIHISNLRPICQSCNLSSGTMNLDAFKKTLQLPDFTPMDTSDD